MRNFTDQEIEQASKNAPRIINEMLEDGFDLVQTLSEIRRTYSLHVDISGLLGELVRNMLIGLINPLEFENELLAAGIAEKQAKEIISEINQKIFVPIQQKMREGSVGAKPPSSAAPPASKPQQADVPRYTAPPPPPPPRPIAPPPQPLPRPPRPSEAFGGGGQMPMPRPVQQPYTPPVRVIPAPPPNLPGAMGADHLLSDHEVEHINVQGTPPPPPRPQMSPPAPRHDEPPPPIPLKKYGVDPYREPME